MTHTKRIQWEAAISGSIPLRERLGNSGTTYLPPGQHLLYCNTTVPTEQLLPDGTDSAFSPPVPWSNRLWAGGRIRFPRPYQFGITESPRLVLVEYVRDARVTGPAGEEKIFVKIERRTGKLDAGRGLNVAKEVALRLKRRAEEDVGNSLVVETRDLCFLREKGSTLPFVRRHIKPPTDPDHSHSLTPTPALLFRFSALTYNAHAIHIDPEYTRNVYGFPDLLVHGPLSLALMLEYVRQVLSKSFGRESNIPIVTEIAYRNLAPLFANEKMTICIKRKGHGRSNQRSSVTSDSVKAGEQNTDEISPHSTSGGESVASFTDESREVEYTSPPKAISGDSGVDIGNGFPTTPSGEENPVRDEKGVDPEQNLQASEPTPQKARKASEKEQYPQEWEVWIQTGQGDKASLAVRGTVKIEMVEKPKRDPPNVEKVDKNKPTQPELTEEEIEMLQKVKALLERQKALGGEYGHAQTKPKRKKQDHKSPRPAAVISPAESTSVSEQSAVKVARLPGDALTRQLVRKISFAKILSLSRPIRSVGTGATSGESDSAIPLPIRKHPAKVNSCFFTEETTTTIQRRRTGATSVESESATSAPIRKHLVKDHRKRFARTPSTAIRKHQAKVHRRVLALQSTKTSKSHKLRDARNIKRAVDMYRVRRVESSEGIRQVFAELKMQSDFDVEGFLSRLNSDVSVGASDTRPSAAGAFERTLRSMLAET